MGEGFENLFFRDLVQYRNPDDQNSQLHHCKKQKNSHRRSFSVSASFTL